MCATAYIFLSNCIRILLIQVNFWYYQSIVLYEFLEVKSMSRITKEQVEHVAHLARLEVTEEEVEMFTNHLDAIIQYAEQLNELDTENIKPTTHVLDIKNVLRKDEVGETTTHEEMMKNAPDSEDGQIKVPAILD